MAVTVLLLALPPLVVLCLVSVTAVSLASGLAGLPYFKFTGDELLLFSSLICPSKNGNRKETLVILYPGAYKFQASHLTLESRYYDLLWQKDASYAFKHNVLLAEIIGCESSSTGYSSNCIMEYDFPKNLIFRNGPTVVRLR